jgi:hypothetical protein
MDSDYVFCDRLLLFMKLPSGPSLSTGATRVLRVLRAFCLWGEGCVLKMRTVLVSPFEHRVRANSAHVGFSDHARINCLRIDQFEVWI